MRVFFRFFTLVVVARLSFILAMGCFDVTMFLPLVEPRMKLLTTSEESCNEDTRCHPKSDDVANGFHFLKEELMHLRVYRNLFIPIGNVTATAQNLHTGKQAPQSAPGNVPDRSSCMCQEDLS
jgi:hypothetical protein